MMDLIQTKIGALTVPGASGAVQAAPGSHTATLTVKGSGPVLATGMVQGSNTGSEWANIGAFAAAGTDAAVASVVWSVDYLYWRYTVNTLTGSEVGCVVSTDSGATDVVRLERDPLARVVLHAEGVEAAANSGLFAGVGGTVLEIGDSLTESGFLSEANGRSTVAQSLLGTAWAELGGPFKRFACGGVSGENTEEILARVPGLLAQWNPSVVVFGPNSVNDMDDGFTPERTIAADLAAINLALKWPGVAQVIIMTIQTTDSSNLETATAGAATRRKWYSAVNAHKKAVAASSGGRVLLIDVNRVVSTANGNSMQAGFSADGTHLTFLGAAEVSRLAAKPVLAKLKFLSQWDMPANATDHTNMMGPYASAMQGDNASGANGYVASTGLTGQGPNGVVPRRASGDATSTGTVTSIASPVGLNGRSIQVVASIGQAGGGVGVAFGQEQSARNRFDNARANSTAYTYGERILISTTLCGQVFTAGTSAAAAPDFTGVVPGDMVADGTVVWLVTKRPVAGMVVDTAIDCSIFGVTGGAQVSAHLTIADGTLSYDRWLNYAGTATFSWPSTFDSSRRLLRQRFTIPADLGSIRTFRFIPMVMGANGAAATLQVHSVALFEAV